VLPIGGLKEKLTAAARAGVKRVLVPERNRNDLIEVPDEVKKLLEITTVETIDQVLDLALLAPTGGRAASPPRAVRVSGERPAPHRAPPDARP